MYLHYKLQRSILKGHFIASPRQVVKVQNFFFYLRSSHNAVVCVFHCSIMYLSGLSGLFLHYDHKEFLQIWAGFACKQLK